MEKITVETSINAPVDKVWQFFVGPKHIMTWNSASPDWHTPKAENYLKVGGRFNYRMEARDGSSGFDFGGVYDEVMPQERIVYTIGDGRRVEVIFRKNGEQTSVIETFDAEKINSLEMQRQGWQAILDNFKKYSEENK